MTTIAGVRFRPADRVHYYSAEVALAVGDGVVAETERGLDLGWVVIAPDQVLAHELPAPPRAIVRQAQPADLRGPTSFRALTAGDLARARERVQLHRLPLTLVAAEYSLDRSRLLIEYTAAAPVDVGLLARDLAGIFRARIALRRLAPRHEEMPSPPPSPTGRGEDGPPLAQGRPAGLYGRLLRGLSAENAQYLAAKERLPYLGQTVETATGPGVVIEVKVRSELVTVRLEDGTLVPLRGARLEAVDPAALPEAREGRVTRGRRGRRGRRPTADGPRPASPDTGEGASPDTRERASLDAGERAVPDTSESDPHTGEPGVSR
jgi:cell fate regulator YaaT (PSP1 superfamily)